MDDKKSYSAAAHRVSALTVSHSVSLEATRTQAEAKQVGETGRDRVADRYRSNSETARGNTDSSQSHSQHTYKNTEKETFKQLRNTWMKSEVLKDCWIGDLCKLLSQDSSPIILQ